MENQTLHMCHDLFGCKHLDAGRVIDMRKCATLLWQVDVLVLICVILLSKLNEVRFFTATSAFPYH